MTLIYPVREWGGADGAMPLPTKYFTTAKAAKDYERAAKNDPYNPRHVCDPVEVYASMGEMHPQDASALPDTAAGSALGNASVLPQ